MDEQYTFRDCGTCWVVHAPGSHKPWITIPYVPYTSDRGKTRVQEIVDALNLKWKG